MTDIMNSLLLSIGGPLFSDGFALVMFILGSFLIFRFFRFLWRL